MKFILTIFLAMISLSATPTCGAAEKKKGSAQISTPQPAPPSKATLNFCEAAKNGNLEMMEIFLQQGAEINNDNCAYDGETPLIRSAHPPYFRPEVFNFLLAHNANPNLQTKAGETALMNLVQITSVDSVLSQIPALFEHGALVDIEDSQGNTALTYAVSTGYNDAEKRNRKFGIIRYLVNIKGANINHQNKDGKTPLMFTAKNCGISTVALMLDLKANTEISTPEGDTAMTLAAEAAARESGDGTCIQVVRILKAVQDAAKNSPAMSEPRT